MKAERKGSIAAALLGGLLPLRPFFFTKPTDPTTETVDLILSPLYIIGRFLPPMGDFGSGAFLLMTMLANAVLYGLVARSIVRRSKT
jgi:hypothetical protein